MNSQDDQQTFLLGMQKARSKLKIARLLFAMSIILISAIAILIFHQYYQMERDYTQSMDSHTIDVELFLDPLKQNSLLSKLEPKDILNVQTVLSDLTEAGIVAEGIPVYRINGSNFDDTDYALHIMGISSEYSYILGNDISMIDDTVYVTAYEKDVMSMKIGIVGEENANGVEINDLKLIDYPCKSVVSEETALSPDKDFGDGCVLRCYVTLKTFQDIAGYELNTNFTDFDAMFTRVSMASPSIEYVCVYVDDLSNVETVNQTLSEKGYVALTVPDPPESLKEFVENTKLVPIIIAILILLASSIYLAHASRSFYKAKEKENRTNTQ